MHVLAFLAIEAEEPECRVDRDCPPQLTCMSESCQNPCRVTNPCSRSQQCLVTDTQTSIRSVACTCPEGTLAGYGGTCGIGKLVFHNSILSIACIFFLFYSECQTTMWIWLWLQLWSEMCTGYLCFCMLSCKLWTQCPLPAQKSQGYLWMHPRVLWQSINCMQQGYVWFLLDYIIHIIL